MAKKNATATTTPAPAAPKSKKAAPAATPTPAANGSNGVHKKKCLRNPQIRILACLAKAKGPMSRKQIAEKAPVEVSWIGEYAGALDDEARAKTEARTGFPSLVTLGFVKAVTLEDVAGVHYTITATGRKALEKAQKE